MQQLHHANTSGYARIRVTGDDSFEFLQGQLTHDLGLLDTREQLLAAWCNPKGRVIALCRVTREDDGYALLLPAELADSVAQRLTMFRFRSKVDFAVEEVSPDDDAIGANPADWRLGNLRAGVAEIGRDQSEAYTPHMLNLDLLDAISLDKGCYTGQEIVARTHYRGASKRRLYLFRCESSASPGDLLLDDERKAGTVVNAIGNEVLAVVSSANLSNLLTISGTPTIRKRLPWENEHGGN